MAIIGIDVGTVRVGCAVADPTVRIPFPVATWQRAAYEAEKNILQLIQERSATLLVVGLPLDASGQRTETCEMVEAFVCRIAKRSPIPIVYVDEAFSSLEAEENIRMGARRAETLDAHSACIILQRYFELNPLK
jgi:putative Holliday junction resolvase